MINSSNSTIQQQQQQQQQGGAVGRGMVLTNDTFLMRINELEVGVSYYHIISQYIGNESVGSSKRSSQLSLSLSVSLNCRHFFEDNKDLSSCLSDIYNSLSITDIQPTTAESNNNNTVANKHIRSKTEKALPTPPPRLNHIGSNGHPTTTNNNNNNSNNSVISPRRPTLLTRSNSETSFESKMGNNHNGMSDDLSSSGSSSATTPPNGKNGNWSAGAVTPKQRSDSIVVGINPNKDPFQRLNNSSSSGSSLPSSPNRILNGSPQNSRENLMSHSSSSTPSNQSPPYSPASLASSTNSVGAYPYNSVPAGSSGSVNSSPQLLSTSPSVEPISLSSSITSADAIKRRPVPIPSIPNRRPPSQTSPTTPSAPMAPLPLVRTASAAPKPISTSPSSSYGTPPPIVPRTSISASTDSLSSSAEDLQTNAILEEPEENPDDPNLVLVKNENGNYLVRGGTLEKLVLRLSYDKSHDTDFAAAFLLTYRSFTTPADLMEMLIKSYNSIGGSSIADEKKRKITRLRVANVVKMWLGEHFHDFEEDSVLVLKLDQFINNQIIPEMDGIGKNLKKLLYHEKVTPVPTFSSAPPPSLAPKAKDPSFIDLDPMEVARQMTLIESDLYRKIDPKECLNQGWNKTDKEERSPNIMAFIRRFNAVSIWVATEVVRAEKIKERVSIVKRFILVAQKCREIGNFNGCMEILSGLQQTSVYRLSKTWEKLESKPLIKNVYDELLDVMVKSKNHKEYRAALHSCHPPCIPYLGVYLTDLTFIEDGMKNTLNGRDELINFEKRRKISVVIREIKQYQQSPYNFSVEEVTCRYLKTLPSFTEKALYKASLSCEAKESRNGSTDGSTSGGSGGAGPSLKKELSQSILKFKDYLNNN
ncbi:leucine-rich repeat-containing protein [Cavenderia fasciculata]|uniref:Leucine-rich repeat-containing protein n=1 Tax=Cavenderia fasciculata TaxID=261658 RepID=F4PLH6_CACFS|nr:leucine-rich repeat-containing protein [Cavenderia fasciculata]EGG23398.1 leucine-rich repeat-containing protein [Cavenderia fasciculata]|eukprot:XP_004361249.1 leucine-rich repeat-containing protein [Cavenderia fasciculata]